MLRALTISNLAVIESVNLEWNGGFSVLTGETGAGKSILIDALGLVAGTRADAGLIRAGAERAEVTAQFELEPGSVAAAWLREQALEDADDPEALVIRRVLQTGGRGRAFINGRAVTTAQLRELGECLIEIFGQSESQTLLRGEVQRRLLDDFAGHSQLVEATAAAAAHVAALDREIEALRNAASDDPAQVEFLRFQVHELEALRLGDGELDALDVEQRRLAGAGRLLQEGGGIQERLYGADESLYDQLAQARGRIDALVALEPALASARDALDGAMAQVQDAAEALRQALEKLDLDPDRLAAVEARLRAIHDLARKHRLRPAQLPEHLRALRARLDALEHGSERLDALLRERGAALDAYRRAAASLSASRQSAARSFGKAVEAIVHTLGMPHAQFAVVVDFDAQGAVSAQGGDSVRFDFSANAGQPPRPLAKVASGGELSRVSLAIQVAALQRAGAPTMIFDEVDAGISGAVAEIVGQRLRALGGERQVLCVTHLAQVAAQGHHHYGIRKQTRGGRTFTIVEPLEREQRVRELARMQGGVEISTAALEHAEDLLRRAG
ncbi:DNA repair protein RecN [Sinimarinibacterium thermocellulolyticum]|uniref:DNA repair protein RecN n=1 Tax=Sinimarinibacterium thermocellulolyticum TaxID=3170016 RepID=A0ABV2ACY4_9GAMM